jgi:hypothetical protein
MCNTNERCQQLRTLHSRLIQEVHTLETDIREEEHDGVANQLEMASIVKSLQRTISSVEPELAQCPENE